jgi:hypothetical protein
MGNFTYLRICMINKLQLVILGVVIVCGAQSNAMESLKLSCGTEARQDGAKLKALREKQHKVEHHHELPMYYDTPCGGGGKVYYGDEGKFYKPYASLKNSGCSHGCP